MICRKCKQEMQKDSLFECGAVIMITGSPKDLGEDMRYICKCGNVEYKREKSIGSILDVYKEGEKLESSRGRDTI